MPTRPERLVPWYHKPKDRCEVTTVKGTQCVYSAGFSASRNGNSQEVPTCKTHSDILAANGWKIRRIRTLMVTF